MTTHDIVIWVTYVVLAIGIGTCVGYIVGRIANDRRLEQRGLQAPLTKFAERDPFARYEDDPLGTDVIEKARYFETYVELDDYARAAGVHPAR